MPFRLQDLSLKARLSLLAVASVGLLLAYVVTNGLLRQAVTHIDVEARCGQYAGEGSHFAPARHLSDGGRAER